MNALMWPGIYSQPHDINLLDINNPTDLYPTSLADIGANPLSSVDVSHCDRGLMIHGRHGSSESQSASLVQQLANLSVKIYNCTATFLDKGQENVDSTDSSRQSASEPPKSIYLDFDQLFSLTTEFINALKSVSVPEKDVASSLYSDILEHAISQSFSSSLVPCGEHMAEALPRTRTIIQSFPDEATMLLIASCNSQLVDAYVSIFDKTEACIEHARVPLRASSWVALLPKLQVGPVALSKVKVSDKSPVSSKSQSFMYIVLVVTLASQLWEQLVDVLRALDGSSSELTAILDIIMGKTNSLMKKVKAIKDLVGRRSGDEPL
ncbi:hypothetical protein CEP54_011509 [Fusarium duplospermum]|uniref:Uncharacterized protein n=1 Tax=Fusarium duplospermum TaxID=1325734 RepID=A0A428PDX5_9HYPO|nr:hypothetical protein CEP54_011509 [Fusarium duplospermum]